LKKRETPKVAIERGGDVLTAGEEKKVHKAFLEREGGLLSYSVGGNRRFPQAAYQEGGKGVGKRKAREASEETPACERCLLGVAPVGGETEWQEKQRIKKSFSKKERPAAHIAGQSLTGKSTSDRKGKR